MPTEQSIDLVSLVRGLLDAVPDDAADKIRQVVDYARRKEAELSALEQRQIVTEETSDANVREAVKLRSELQRANAQLAKGVSEIATLQQTIADLQDKLKASGEAKSARAIADLVQDLRADAANLFAAPFRSEESSGVPGVVVDGLDFEIRGALDIGDKVGLRAVSASQAGPDTVSIVRFSLRPEMRIREPD